MLKQAAKLVATVSITAILVVFIAWWPVIDRIIHWCEYYPQSLADCRD